METNRGKIRKIYLVKYKVDPRFRQAHLLKDPVSGGVYSNCMNRKAHHLHCKHGPEADSTIAPTS